MVSPGSLIKRMSSHHSWPYPRSERQVKQVITVSLIILLTALAGITAGLKYNDEKTLGSDDIYFAAKSIVSYSNETRLIATGTQHQPLIGPYRETYVQQLATNVSDVKDKLSTHEIKGDVQPQARHLQEVCDQLAGVLAALKRTPSDQTFAATTELLQALAEQAQQIEESV